MSLLPLLAMPGVIQVQRKVKSAQSATEEENPDEEEPKLSLVRHIAFYMPEVVLFVNNTSHAAVFFVLPVS